MKQEEFLTAVIQQTKQALRDSIDKVKATIGQHPGQKVMTPRQQLQAYRSLTAEDLQALREKWGAEQFSKYVLEMESRSRRRQHGSESTD